MHITSIFPINSTKSDVRNSNTSYRLDRNAFRQTNHLFFSIHLRSIVHIGSP